MRPMIAAAFAALLHVLSLSAVHAEREKTPLELVIGCSPHKRVCVVQDNEGGIPLLFEHAAREVLKHGIRVRIRGNCPSSCVIFTSIARGNVCLEAGAVMKIHRGTMYAVFEPFGKEVDISTDAGLEIVENPPIFYRRETAYFTPNYGSDINAWALRENKMVYDGMYTMTPKEAAQFWKSCRK